MSLLKLENISKFYQSGSLVSVGITKINTEFNFGEFVAVTGESGSGKTTLVNVLSGLDTYQEGELYINDNETSHFLTKDWEKYRSNYIGFVFQNYNIIESYTVYQNVMIALEMENYPKENRKKRALELIERVGLLSHKNHKAAKLSGGEKQRTVIARALAKDAPIIVADEPTGNLDSEASQNIINLLHEISKDKLVIIVTHDFDIVKDYATRRIKMHDGNIIEDKQLKPKKEIENIFTEKNESMNFLSVIKMALRNITAMPRRFFFFIILQILIVSLFTYVYANMMSLARSDFFDFGFNLNTGVFDFNTKRVPDNRMFIIKKDYTEFTNQEYNEIESLGLNDSFIYKNTFFVDNLRDLDVSYFDPEFNRNIYDNSSNFDSTYTILGYESFMLKKDYTSLDSLGDNDIIVSNSFKSLDIGDIIKLRYTELVRNDIPYTFEDGILTYEFGDSFKNDFAVEFLNEFGNKDKLYLWGGVDDLSDYGDITILNVYTEGYNDVVKNLTIKGIYNDNRRGVIYFSHNSLIEENLSNVLTVVSKNNARANDAFKRIDKNKFRDIFPENESDAISNLFKPFNFLFSLFFYAVIVAMGLFLYFLLFLVLRNVMESRRKDFAIYRSIGAHQTNLGWLVIIEQLILTISAFLISMLFFVIGSRFNYSLYIMLSHIKYFDYIIILLTLTYFSTWLARRFNKKTFNLSIIENITESKELEL